MSRPIDGCECPSCVILRGDRYLVQRRAKTLGEEILRDKVSRAADPIEYLIGEVLLERRRRLRPCHSCDGSGIERFDYGLPERCSLCRGRGV